ncbi:hypothetical protein HOC01_00735 [archaeon]|jgi:hypothetical protein|nr:hypothetical protein [archaeon]MBT4604140.1 hypothetical protein [archaeon]MBT6698633.1 hypothetical protein [archaeon]
MSIISHRSLIDAKQILQRVSVIVNSFSGIDELANKVAAKKQALGLLHKLKDQILRVIGDHHGTLFDEEVAQLNETVSLIGRIGHAPDTLETELPKLEKSLEFPFFLNTVWLLRHTDKRKGGPAQQSNGFWRSIPGSGVAQAKEFGRYLSQEILLCPKPVVLEIHHSEASTNKEARRARTFARIIRKQVQKNNHGGHVKIKMMEHPALYFRFGDESLQKIRARMETAESQFAAFQEWVQGKVSYKDGRTTHDPEKIASELRAWAQEGTKHKEAGKHYIRVGVSHSWIVDTLLHFAIPEAHPDIIATAGRVRFRADHIKYRGTEKKIF